MLIVESTLSPSKSGMLPSLSPLGTERTSFPILRSSPKNTHVTVSFFEHHVTVSSPENLVTVFLWLGYVLLNNPQTQIIHTKGNRLRPISISICYRSPFVGISALIRRWGFFCPQFPFLYILYGYFQLHSLFISPSVCSMASSLTNIPFSSRTTGYRGISSARTDNHFDIPLISYVYLDFVFHLKLMQK